MVHPTGIRWFKVLDDQGPSQPTGLIFFYISFYIFYIFPINWTMTLIRSSISYVSSGSGGRGNIGAI